MQTFIKLSPDKVTTIIQTLKASRRRGAKSLGEEIEASLLGLPPVELELIGPDAEELGEDEEEDEVEEMLNQRDQ